MALFASQQENNILVYLMASSSTNVCTRDIRNLLIHGALTTGDTITIFMERLKNSHNTMYLSTYFYTPDIDVGHVQNNGFRSVQTYTT